MLNVCWQLVWLFEDVTNMGSRRNMSQAFSKFLFHFILLLHYLNGGGSSSDSGSHHHDEVLVD